MRWRCLSIVSDPWNVSVFSLLLSPRVSSAQFERRCVYVNSRYVRDTKHKGSVFFSEIVNHVINKDVHIGQDGDFATTRDDCSSHTSTMF